MTCVIKNSEVSKKGRGFFCGDCPEARNFWGDRAPWGVVNTPALKSCRSVYRRRRSTTEASARASEASDADSSCGRKAREGHSSECFVGAFGSLFARGSLPLLPS